MVAPPVAFSPDILRKLAELETVVGVAIRGKTEVIRLSLVCLLARGHLLIEDVPGVGKTTLAQALARAANCRFHRLQFTSDMLPSDVLGVTIYNAHAGAFEFKPGPIFSNFLLADEINRTTPKTQSALLEAMNESQVTIDGKSHSLPRPFMVIATQNPVEHHGTYPLPESQLDRFLMRLRIGYPDAASERQILRNGEREACSRARLRPDRRGRSPACRKRCTRVTVDEAIVDYMLAIVERTRSHESLALGVSPRGSQALFRAGAGAGAGRRPRLCRPRRRQAPGRSAVRPPRRDQYADHPGAAPRRCRRAHHRRDPQPGGSSPVDKRSHYEDCHYRPAHDGQDLSVHDPDRRPSGDAHRLHLRAHRRRQGSRRPPGSAGPTLRAQQDHTCHCGVRGHALHLQGDPARPRRCRQPAQRGCLRARAAPLRRRDHSPREGLGRSGARYGGRGDRADPERLRGDRKAPGAARQGPQEDQESRTRQGVRTAA